MNLVGDRRKEALISFKGKSEPPHVGSYQKQRSARPTRLRGILHGVLPDFAGCAVKRTVFIRDILI